MKLNLELRNSTNATTVAVAKITGERGWRVGKKVSSASFFLADPAEDRSFVEKMRLGASYSTSNKLLLVAMTDTFSLWASENAFNIHKFTVTAFHCEESTHRK